MKVDRTIVANALEVKRASPVNLDINDTNFFSDGFAYETKIVTKNSYQQVTATEYALYDKLHLIPECLANPIHYRRMQYKHLLQKKLFHKKMRLSTGENYLFVHDYWSNSHYHWLCDVLPRLWCIKDELKNYTLLLPSQSYIRANALLTLKLTGLEPGNVIFMDADKYYEAPSLTMVSHVTTNGTTRPDTMTNLKRNIFTNNNISAAPSAKIYVSRTKARYRKILNEAAVEACFKNHGYEIIRFEEYSLQEQINLCANASVLAGIHGAGHTNALFLPEQANLLEFRRDGIHHNHCYWDLASSTNLNYYYCFGTPDSDKPIEGNGCNLTMDILKLEKVLESMG